MISGDDPETSDDDDDDDERSPNPNVAAHHEQPRVSYNAGPSRPTNPFILALPSEKEGGDRRAVAASSF